MARQPKVAIYVRVSTDEQTCAGMRSAKVRDSKIGNQKRLFDKKKATKLCDQGWGRFGSPGCSADTE